MKYALLIAAPASLCCTAAYAAIPIELFDGTANYSSGFNVITLPDSPQGLASRFIYSFEFSTTVRSIGFVRYEYSNGSQRNLCSNRCLRTSVDGNPAFYFYDGGRATDNIVTLLGFTASRPGTLTYTLASVPEPSAWSLMIIGFGAVGYALRNTRRRTLKVSYA